MVKDLKKTTCCEFWMQETVFPHQKTKIRTNLFIPTKFSFATMRKLIFY